MSPFQSFKMVIVETIHLSKDGIHIYIGFGCFMLAVIVGNRKASSYKSLLPGLVVSLMLEALDLRDDYVSRGVFRWAASLKDIVNTNLIPVLLCVAFKRRMLRDRGLSPEEPRA